MTKYLSAAALILALLSASALAAVSKKNGIAHVQKTIHSTESVNTMSVSDTKAKQNSQIQFTTKDELENWVIVNDTVMGGRSRAGLGIKEEYLIFAGDLSLQNNGGFASTRRVNAPVEWSGKQALQISVKGDGRTYQFRLRTNRNWDGVAYVAEFQTTEGEDQIIEFSLSDFQPLFRGRFVRGAPTLKFEDVSQVGFMLADKKPGEFVLLVKEIKQLPEFI